MTYRSEIDGLRAFSIIAVLLYHAGFSYLPGGFLGVDVFFVISGFLITTHIDQAIKNNTFSLFGFYIRRVKRLLPAILFMVSVVTPIAWFITDPYELKEFGQSIVSTFTFSSNIFFYLKTGYFDTASELKPLLHTWSLAIEEQYYFIYPILFVFLAKTNKKILGLSVIALCSWFFAVFSYNDSPSLTYFMLHTRAWQLLLGAIIALITIEHSCKLKQLSSLTLNLLSLAGLVLVCIGFAFVPSSVAYLPLYSSISVFGCALVLLFCCSPSPTYKLLTLPIITWFGLISYSLYLFHQPLFALARIYVLEELSVWQVSALLLVTIALSYFSKMYVEDFFRFKYKKGSERWILTQLLPFILLFVALGLAAHKTRGFPSRTDLGGLLAQNYGLSAKCSGANINTLACRTSDNPNTLLWGDSYAMHLAKAIAKISPQGLSQTTLSACTPSADTVLSKHNSVKCSTYNQNVVTYLLGGDHPIERVFISSAFSTASETQFESLKVVIEQFQTKGIEVVLISPPPVHSGTLKCIKIAERNDGDYATCRFPMLEANNNGVIERVRDLANSVNVRVIDLREFICPDETMCEVEIMGVLLYRDNGHLTNSSADLLTDFLSERFTK